MMWTFYILSIFFLRIGITANAYNMFHSKTQLSHLTVDTERGTVYIGAVNKLYQLTADLRVIHEANIGPRMDNKMCTPPFEDCPELVLTDNYIKLLAMDMSKDRIVVCGSLFKGICSLRRINNITEEILYDITKGEKSFVVSNHNHISSVGLVADVENTTVLVVGNSKEHFTMSDVTRLVSSRLIDELQGRDSFETVSENSYIQGDFGSDMYTTFVKVFQTQNHIYFVLTRQEKLSGQKKTYISRQCKNDLNYYSFIEIALECNTGNTFTVVQSAYVMELGKKLSRGLTSAGIYGNVAPQNKAVFALFYNAAKSGISEESALCIFPLKEIDKKVEQVRVKAYSGDTKEKSKKVIYQAYGLETWKGQLDGKKAASQFPCGEEHLPFPLRSSLGLTVHPVTQYNRSLTAVAVTVEGNHTVVFLGTSDGKILQVSLHGITAEEYKTIDLGNDGPVKSELVFDAKQEHLYVMTNTTVTRLPVEECVKFMDCQSCISSHDPFCGWCVSEEKCTKASKCTSGSEENGWLVWNSPHACVTNVTVVPPSNTGPTKNHQQTQNVKQEETWIEHADANGQHSKNISSLLP
ncbi:plexin-B2-like [Protopterus annectens]|uniref:plexin-B2-like n=1 Tax=Protopterus annectens TaxID=7888 RepID=UPI001CFB1BAA|nr:plexin-B2-like [Protopterus annectens]